MIQEVQISSPNVRSAFTFTAFTFAIFISLISVIFHVTAFTRNKQTRQNQVTTVLFRQNFYQEELFV